MTTASTQIDVFLQPGECLVADARYRIRTLLGSCVSITLWHPPTCRGGMSHCLLPTRGARAPDDELDGRYGDEALQMILHELARIGVEPTQCEAKIFGGGNMFPDHAHAGLVHVGQRNGEAARELLRQAGITVVSESLFGDGHRQIIFDIGSGDVWAHQVRPALIEIDAGGSRT